MNALEAIAAHAGDPTLLTRSPSRGRASAADLAPQAPRPGSLRGLDCPSRIGNRLHHRDGRITDMNGVLIPTPAKTLK
jgi:hypothetical protein